MTTQSVAVAVTSVPQPVVFDQARQAYTAVVPTQVADGYDVAIDVYTMVGHVSAALTFAAVTGGNEIDIQITGLGGDAVPITAFYQGTGGIDHGRADAATTDSTGAAKLNLVPGTYNLTLVIRGITITLLAFQVFTGVSAFSNTGGTIPHTHKVVDQAGAALAGVTVKIVDLAVPEIVALTATDGAGLWSALFQQTKTYKITFEKAAYDFQQVTIQNLVTDVMPDSVLDAIVLYPYNVAHPAKPTALVANYTTNKQDRNANQIVLSWTAPAASPDVRSYNVYRNGGKIGTSATTTYTDTTPGGDVGFFTYFIAAVDVEGNEGVLSDSICNFSQRVNKLLDDLRASLKDNPPDPRVQRWTDDDLFLALNMGLSRVNAIPMLTTFNLDTLPPDLYNYVLVAGRLAAIRSQQTLEAAKEFSMGAGGVTINISRTAIYGGLIASEEQAWQKEIENIKRWFTMRTVFGEGFMNNTMPFKIRTYAPRQYRVR